MVIVEIIWVVLVIACLIGLIVSLNGIRNSGLMMKRNQEAYDFRISLLDLASRHDARRIDDGTFKEEDNALLWFFHKYTYEQMLYSDKPLTLEAWYTEEEINRIKS